MNELLLLEKQVGETPLECMNRFRTAHSEYADTPMTYAGRLDPMADGVLVVLAGDMVHRKDEFLGLDKEYRCTAILGASTDTYDILGIPNNYSVLVEGFVPDAPQTLESFLGTFQQPYPPYSSKTIDGVQMHELARQGKLEGVRVPARTVTVFDVSNISVTTISRTDLLSDITERIRTITGDFRQEQILNAWQHWNPGIEIPIVSFTIHVSSGTYIRGIVDELGKRLGIGACIWKLTRTRVGDYKRTK